MTFRNRKTGKLVTATFAPAFETATSRQAHDLYNYRSLRDGQPFGPCMAKRASRFLELYEEVSE
jgi:hypothetical protein